VTDDEQNKTSWQGEASPKPKVNTLSRMQKD